MSMRAFGNKLRAALEPRLRKLGAQAKRTEWALLLSEPSGDIIYNGPSLDELLDTAEKQRFFSGNHDFAPAFSAALDHSSLETAIIFVTDHPMEVPKGVTLLAIGEPFNNWGFSGALVEKGEQGYTYQAVIRSYSSQRETRIVQSWSEKGDVVKTSLTLEPGKGSILAGAFPADAAKILLTIEGDEFAFDDVTPLVAPVPKKLRVYVSPAMRHVMFGKHLARSLPNVELLNDAESAHLLLIGEEQQSLISSGQRAIIFGSSERGSANPSSLIVPEGGSITEDLNFASLLVGPGKPRSMEANERAVVWQGGDALVSEAKDTSTSRLYINFYLTRSNAARLGSFIILLHRFIEEARSAQGGSYADNFELNQPLDLNLGAESQPEILIAADLSTPHVKSLSSSTIARAPSEPVFFSVRDKDGVQMEGASHFADANESDFRSAGSFDGVSGLEVASASRSATTSLAPPFSLLILGLLILFSWLLQNSRLPRLGSSWREVWTS